MARTIMNESKIVEFFWVQVVHTTVHILNKSLLRSNSGQTPYGLWKRRLANVKHFRVFGRKCYIKIIDDNLGKFQSITNEGMFLGFN